MIFSNMNAKISFATFLLLATACNTSLTIADFSSDGCSLFPDQNLITKEKWCECCFDHDIAYWKGGTKEERESADQTLKNCVLEKTDDPLLANTVYNGVRFGGSPYFYNWYRWGYGWKYGRGFKPLSAKEQKKSEQKLSVYFKENPENVCK